MLDLRVLVGIGYREIKDAHWKHAVLIIPLNSFTVPSYDPKIKFTKEPPSGLTRKIKLLDVSLISVHTLKALLLGRNYRSLKPVFVMP